jgi:hypothetical protein
MANLAEPRSLGIREPQASLQVAPLCIRLLPRVLDGESLVRPGVKDPWLWLRLQDPILGNQIFIPQQQLLVQLGRIKARTGLRMMPTFP